MEHLRPHPNSIFNPVAAEKLQCVLRRARKLGLPFSQEALNGMNPPPKHHSTVFQNSLHGFPPAPLGHLHKPGVGGAQEPA